VISQTWIILVENLLTFLINYQSIFFFSGNRPQVTQPIVLETKNIFLFRSQSNDRIVIFATPRVAWHVLKIKIFYLAYYNAGVGVVAVNSKIVGLISALKNDVLYYWHSYMLPPRFFLGPVKPPWRWRSKT
jgi:hypothetical protein